jgi:lipoate-protein ligase A
MLPERKLALRIGKGFSGNFSTFRFLDNSGFSTGGSLPVVFAGPQVLIIGMPDENPPPPLAVLRLWDDRAMARSGPENMAVDEALLAEAGERGTPVLRVYQWDRTTLSFGYFLPEAEAVAAIRPGEARIRRWTGGGVVHHEGAVTWSLVVPPNQAFSQVRPVESYARLHEALARCLREAGLEGISLVPATRAAPAGGLCAEAPSPGDLLRDGRKLAGAGQRRTRLGLLHQGVVFLPETELPADFPGRLAAALAEKIEPFAPPPGWVFPTARYEDPAWNARR